MMNMKYYFAHMVCYYLLYTFILCSTWYVEHVLHFRVNKHTSFPPSYKPIQLFCLTHSNLSLLLIRKPDSAFVTWSIKARFIGLFFRKENKKTKNEKKWKRVMTGIELLWWYKNSHSLCLDWIDIVCINIDILGTWMET